MSGRIVSSRNVSSRNVLNRNDLVLGPGEGKTLLEIGGARVVAKLDSEDTEGACALLEYTIPPGMSGPPPHKHEQTAESFFLLEGRMTMILEGDELELSAGSFARVPAGVVHTFRNRSEVPTRLLILMTPGGFEEYFERLGALIEEEGGMWPLPDMSKVAALQSQFDMVNVQPAAKPVERP